MLSKEGEIRRDEACMDYAGSDVILYPCHGSKGNQYWEYNPEVSHQGEQCWGGEKDTKITKQRLLLAPEGLKQGHHGTVREAVKGSRIQSEGEGRRRKLYHFNLSGVTLKGKEI